MNLSAFSVELNAGTPVEDYWLPVVTEGAEPQEGGVIAHDSVRARGNSGCHTRPFRFFCVNNTCQLFFVSTKLFTKKTPKI